MLMTIEHIIGNMKPVPFRQQPMMVARVKNPVLQVPSGFINLESLYELSSYESNGTNYIVFRELKESDIGGK